MGGCQSCKGCTGAACVSAVRPPNGQSSAIHSHGSHGIKAAPFKTLKANGTLEELDALIKESDHKTLVIVEYFAPWCGLCRFIDPKVKRWAQDFEGKLTFIKVNTDENDDIAEEKEILAMPTFMFYKDGKLLDVIIGAKTENMEDMINKHTHNSDD